MGLGRRIAGMVLLLTGLVWLLQGIRLLPGSFMTGALFWAVTGAVLAVAGVAILARRPRNP